MAVAMSNNEVLDLDRQLADPYPGRLVDGVRDGRSAPQDSAFVGLSNCPSFDRNHAGKERTKTSFGHFESILCSEHAIDRSAHLFQNKFRCHATHHFELIRLTWANFKSISLHSFDGDLNHFFDLHGRSAF